MQQSVEGGNQHGDDTLEATALSGACKERSLTTHSMCNKADAANAAMYKLTAKLYEASYQIDTTASPWLTAPPAQPPIVPPAPPPPPLLLPGRPFHAPEVQVMLRS